MNKTSIKTIFAVCTAFVFTCLYILLVTSFVFAATNAKPEFVPLAGIPGVTEGRPELNSYLNALYILVISVGALIAVIKIAIAGVKYTLSDVVTSKESAKSDITGALLGLAILLSTFVVLNTIYPNLTNLNVLGGASNFNGPISKAPPNNNKETVTETGDKSFSGGITSAVALQAKKECAPEKPIFTGDSFRCPNRLTNNATFNTVDQFNSNLESSTIITAPAKAENLRRFNEFVGSQEPKNFPNQTDIDAVIKEEGGSLDEAKALFVVNNLTAISSRSNDITNQQKGLCAKFEGKIGISKDNSFKVCVIEK